MTTKRQPKREQISSDQYREVGSLTARLVEAFGPSLGLIAVVVLVGILSLQFAHNIETVISITVIVVSALAAVLVGRIKNVL